jgi:dTDP-4-dehydrorhamnose 3,5-epimerase
MQIAPLAIPEIKILRPKRFADDRGFFSETWNRRALAEQGLEFDFIQENQSLSRSVGTVRGLHFQAPPRAQDKLVRVVRGRIYDVAVDIRKGSESYGRWVGAEISADEWNQILVPAGFAHGFCTLEPDTEVIYLVTDTWSKDDEFAIRWNDPHLRIDWPVRSSEAQLSEKDRLAPAFADLASPF